MSCDDCFFFVEQICQSPHDDLCEDFSAFSDFARSSLEECDVL
ncbi:hypothetical protein [Sigmofec virus UA08Rod_5645]|uniref:Uncharacterized protein n=1 Tax=Sigmofec virus UA08Rod_5645 TaxID=2929433 RepID=A0A976N220_9VIRU|nr:hypothetical protein [Sigmofec virus UA08Rod_5645]